jgi:hypothetical protein
LDARVWDDATDAELVEALRAIERMAAWVAAVQVEVLAEFARRPPDPRDPVGGCPR